MAYIIGPYNRFDAWDRAHSVYKFEINGGWYAIKEVEMCWGMPKLPQYVDREDTHTYCVYDTKADALRFVQLMKKLN